VSRLPGSVVLCLSGLLLAGAAAAFQVTSTVPAGNSAAARFTAIRVDFDAPVDPSSVTPASFRVFGRASGVTSGSLVFSNGDRTVTFTPSGRFVAGERVVVNLSTAVEAADGSPLTTGSYFFGFVVAGGQTAGALSQVQHLNTRTLPADAVALYGVNVADLDNDGAVDLATINEDSGDLRVFLNQGGGTGLFSVPFLTPQTLDTSSSPSVTADFDADGETDLVVSPADADAIFVLLGNGDGTFGTPQVVAAGLTNKGLAVVDVEGDGDDDILVANRDSSDIALTLNDGSGVFGAASFFDGGVGGEHGLDSGDMDGDGIADLVVAGRPGADISVLLGNGSGGFGTPSPAISTGGGTWVVVLADIDGDGNLDAATANGRSDSASVLLGDGLGGLGPATRFPVSGQIASVDLGDIDGDGDVDMITSNTDFWNLYANDGSGNLSLSSQIAAPSQAACAAILDFDDDGDVDIAFTDERTDDIFIYHRAGVPVSVPSLSDPGRALLVLGCAALGLRLARRR
jgi:hypothetical protein